VTEEAAKKAAALRRKVTRSNSCAMCHVERPVSAGSADPLVCHLCRRAHPMLGPARPADPARRRAANRARELRRHRKVRRSRARACAGCGVAREFSCRSLPEGLYTCRECRREERAAG